ncbi:TPA: ATP-binding cassette domain-containing protein [Thermoplasmata archaeon]|nr:ATP-binding cassette domain-containing protein [Thermoplasmata archaeon]
MEIDEGDITLLLGRNNAGKSTFCRLLSGLVPHSLPAEVEGEVEVLGRTVKRTSVARLSTMVGSVFQEPESQLFCMSAEEEVAFGPENIALPREEIAARVEWALEEVGLSGFNKRAPSSLSGGEKQRLAIAAALSMRPRLLVLDEPTYALDPVGRSDLYDLLLTLRKKHMMTIVLAERDAEEMTGFCDRIILLKDGSVLADDKPRNVLSQVELLEAAGVAPPQMAELSSLMSRKYPGLVNEFMTVDEAELEISRLAGNVSGGRP